MEEKNLYPLLRFPSYSEGWINVELAKIGRYLGGGTPDRTKLEYWEGSFPWISSSDIVENDIHNISTTRFITRQAIDESATKVIPKNSILIVSRVGIGKFAIANTDLCTSQDFTNITVDSSKFDSFFLGYLFSARKARFLRLSQGTSIKGFTSDDIKKSRFVMPKALEEQRKIALFLTSVDKRIDLLIQKRNELEQYKNGVMYKIFNQEVRFKDADGNDYPAWKKKKIGDIGKTYNGLTGKSKEDFGIGKRYIQYMQIFSNSKIEIRHFGLVDVNKNDNQNKVKKGDVFFTTSSETPNEIGTASVLLEDVEDVYLNSFCFGFRPNSVLELIPEFAQFLFRSGPVRRKIIRLAQGSTRYNMSKMEFMKQTIMLPIPEEQLKIASFLSAIDNKIENVKLQIDIVNKWKKGLLQQMFV